MMKFDEKLRRLFADNIELFQLQSHIESLSFRDSDAHSSQNDCNNEDAELYGFSWIPTIESCTSNIHSDTSTGRSSRYTGDHINESNHNDEVIANIIRCDRNWENPSAVSLMSESFGIRSPFASVFWSKDPRKDMPSSTAIKASQDLYWAKITSSAATVCIAEGNLAKAMTMLDDALDLAPTHVPALINRGKLHLNAKRFPLANVDIQKALQIDPLNEAALTLNESCTRQLPKTQVTKEHIRLDSNLSSYPLSESTISEAPNLSSSFSGFEGLIKKLNGSISARNEIDVGDSSSDYSTSDQDSHSTIRSSKKSKRRKGKLKRKKKSKKLTKEKKSKKQ